MFWRNSSFQVAYFIVGKCHTIDEAYRVALELRHERDTSIKQASENQQSIASPEYAEALRERAFLDAIVGKLRDHSGRKYAHLPDHKAHQACQQEEWKLKLIHRAKTFLITTGTIPQDHLEIMMAHPEFKAAILPAIASLQEKVRTGKATLGDLPETPALLGDCSAV